MKSSLFSLPSRLNRPRQVPKELILYNEKVPAEPLIEIGRESGEVAHKPLQVKTFLMILIMVIAGPVGNVFLSKGMKEVSPLTLWPPAQVLHSALKIFTTIPIWLGISSLITFFIAYMLVLSWADYSYVQPVSSVAYGVVALLGYLVLGEKISALRWAGIAVICLGVFVVSRTGPQTTSRKTAEEA